MNNLPVRLTDLQGHDDRSVRWNGLTVSCRGQALRLGSANVLHDRPETDGEKPRDVSVIELRACRRIRPSIRETANSARSITRSNSALICSISRSCFASADISTSSRGLMKYRKSAYWDRMTRSGQNNDFNSPYASSSSRSAIASFRSRLLRARFASFLRSFCHFESRFHDRRCILDTRFPDRAPPWPPTPSTSVPSIRHPLRRPRAWHRPSTLDGASLDAWNGKSTTKPP